MLQWKSAKKAMVGSSGAKGDSKKSKSK